MKILALFFNIILFGFICLVLVTDGPPDEAIYIVFTLWSLFTPILNSVVIFLSGASNGWLGLFMERKSSEEQKKIYGRFSARTIMRIAAIVCNIVFIGFSCWALIDRYPHPKEDGFIAFVVLMFLTPILSLLVLFFSGARGWPGFPMKKKWYQAQI